MLVGQLLSRNLVLQHIIGYNYKILHFSSCLIHSRPEMKKTEKQLGVDFFSKILPDISESFECMNPTMQEIVRSVVQHFNFLGS